MDHEAFPFSQVTAIGALDLQLRNGRPVASMMQRHPIHGFEEHALLQLRSAFARPFSLTLILDRSSAGAHMLQGTQAGKRLAATGYLEWERRAIQGLPKAIQLARTAYHCSLRVTTLCLAEEDQESGCDIQLTGKIITAPRAAPHPQNPSIRVATTILELQHAQQRAGSQAQFNNCERIPLAIPVNHSDAPNLFRMGNSVRIAGMLERVPVPLNGKDIDQALKDLEALWETQRASISDSHTLQQAEKQYSYQRRRIKEISISRVVVGFAELLKGEAISLRAAQNAESRRHHHAAGTAHSRI